MTTSPRLEVGVLLLVKEESFKNHSIVPSLTRRGGSDFIGDSSPTGALAQVGGDLTPKTANTNIIHQTAEIKVIIFAPCE
jgi:hypothetical protein